MLLELGQYAIHLVEHKSLCFLGNDQQNHAIPKSTRLHLPFLQILCYPVKQTKESDVAETF